MTTIPQRRVIAFSTGLALPVLVVATLAGARALSSHSSRRLTQGEAIGSVMHLPDLGGGTRVTLAQAEFITGLPMILPQTSSASSDTISEVWARAGQDKKVLVEYASGVNVEIQPWSLPESPTDKWNSVTAEGIQGSITAIGGLDMYVMPPGGTNQGGSISFVKNGIYVTVYGDNAVDLDGLEQLAQSAALST